MVLVLFVIGGATFMAAVAAIVSLGFGASGIVAGGYFKSNRNRYRSSSSSCLRFRGRGFPVCRVWRVHPSRWCVRGSHQSGDDWAACAGCCGCWCNCGSVRSGDCRGQFLGEGLKTKRAMVDGWPDFSRPFIDRYLECSLKCWVWRMLDENRTCFRIFSSE